METLVYCIATLLLGTVFGFVLGTAGRLFFRHSFKEYVKDGMRVGEEQINQQIQNAQAQMHGLVAGAHAQAAEIYKAAAAEALKAGVKNIPAPPTSGLN